MLLTAATFAFRLQMEQVQIAADKKLLYDASTPYLTASQPIQIKSTHRLESNTLRS
ncbi:MULTISPECIES: hypothetical protein [unclassified Cryobacterium]|uniref:hypothetical protein n=1 Tax=unclassified Cryobacterium TaxID=2649013 RepID=UPI00141BDD14|nr:MULTISPECIES: hypothetical protein [unclassified Cryobacterium]